MKIKKAKTIISVALVAALLSATAISANAYSGYAYSFGGDYSTSQSVTNTAITWNSCGYTSYYTTTPTYSYLNSSNVLNSDILYFDAYGSQNLIKLKTGLYLTNGTSNGSDEVGIASYTLSNTRLVIYNCGYTASGSSNLCTTTRSRGADAVIGWKGGIISSDAVTWQERFQSYCKKGYRVNLAMDYADSFSDYSNNSAIKNHLIYGNWEQVILKTSTSSASELSESTICSELETSPDRVINIDEIECTFDDIDYDAINAAIKAEFSDFDASEYETAVTSTSLDDSSFVIDYTLKVGDYSTNSGYTIIFRDDKASTLYNNTIQSNSVVMSVDNDIPDVEAYEVAAIEQAQSDINEICEGSTIVNQNITPYYDINTDTYYCKVITEYDHMNSGCYDTIQTLYPVSE